LKEDALPGSIICGVDDSESAHAAARVARTLSSVLGLGLVFVRVVEDGSSEQRMNAVAERLEQLGDSAGEVDCGADWVVDAGRPADRLVAAAAARKARMIVIGSQGPRSSPLGSVLAEVSRRARCPVVVVPPGADAGLSGGVSFPGGIVRFGLGGAVTGSAGGIARFGLGPVAHRTKD
jgi:nucleotide-binding universal stress UspA family protein